MINEAYQTLVDPIRRTFYDEKLFSDTDIKKLGPQSEAQRYHETKDETDGIDFSATWKEFRPRSI